MEIDVTTAVTMLKVVEAQLTDEAMLCALRRVCRAALFGDDEQRSCETCVNYEYVNRNDCPNFIRTKRGDER